MYLTSSLASGVALNLFDGNRKGGKSLETDQIINPNSFLPPVPGIMYRNNRNISFVQWFHSELQLLM